MPRQADFSQKTKDTLAAKVGYRCSNPFCRKSTIGANADGSGTINIGEAAHITAAEPGGARYDATQKYGACHRVHSVNNCSQCNQAISA